MIFFIKMPVIHKGEKTVSSTNVAGEIGYYMKKDETRFSCHFSQTSTLSGSRISM